MAQMLIANRLRDGRVVFRAADHSWVQSITAGVLIDDIEQADRLLQLSRIDADNSLILDPNLITVTEKAGMRTPAAIREAIRAIGPTIEVEV